MKPTIYLGLGGTGVQTLLYLKQQFVNSYGEERMLHVYLILTLPLKQHTYVMKRAV